MDHVTKFVMSHRPYAVDLSSLTAKQDQRTDRDTYNLRGSVNAVWYRKQAGVIRACVGTIMLWSHNLPGPVNLDDPRDVLSAELDGRYGGDCHGRWDGTSYWGVGGRPEVMERDLALLRPMLDNYPGIPAGYDGWWRF